jgi:hypothetical protein
MAPFITLKLPKSAKCKNTRNNETVDAEKKLKAANDTEANDSTYAATSKRTTMMTSSKRESENKNENDAMTSQYGAETGSAGEGGEVQAGAGTGSGDRLEKIVAQVYKEFWEKTAAEGRPSK